MLDVYRVLLRNIPPSLGFHGNQYRMKLLGAMSFSLSFPVYWGGFVYFFLFAAACVGFTYFRR